MGNKKKITPIVIAAMVAVAIVTLAAFIIPASASGNPGAGCPSDTRFYDTIHGGVYFEQQGWAQSNSMTRTFDNIPDGIKLARIYTGVWQGSPSKGGKFNITIQNATGSYTTPTYQACDPCPGEPCADSQSQRCDALNWAGNVPPNVPSGDIHDYIVGCGVHFISFNATPYITPGTNTITVKTSCCDSCTCWDSRIYLIALLVVYEDSNMPEMTYWINEGAPYLEKGSACDGPDDHTDASMYFNGTHVSNPTRVKLWTLGWPHVINATESPAYTKLNGNAIGYPDITESYAGGDNEVLLRWNNISTGYLNTNSNLLEFYDPEPFYERAFAAVLMVQRRSDQPDFTVTDIEFPTVMRPNTGYTITALIENYGNTSGAFNVSLEVDGSPYDKKSVPGMDAETSTTVNFPVNLAEGCHEFNITADSDNDIIEANENNNERTEKYQVGNVIVVRSNSDFDALVSEGLATKVSDTYYIEDLDITNCVGRGIDIQNTNVPFVINNCTVHDCEESGVHFKSLTNGKITDSTVETNHLKGIRLQNCSYVVIANNTVQNNDKYGIDVYMEVMPYPDCEYITITNNTAIGNLYGVELIGDNCVVCDNLIRNNTASTPGSDEGFGIYCFGNYSKIYNNTIAYNDNYGIYMDYDTPSHPCFGNCIFGNTFTGNNLEFPGHTSQAYDSGNNYWNSTVKLGYYNDTGSPFDNYMGNYWSDYESRYPGAGEVDGSEIWDTSYEIDGGTMKDNSPLMQPWVNYERILCGDVDCSRGVTTADLYPLFRRVYGDPVCSDWAADVDCSGGITTADIYPVFRRVYGDPLNCCKACEQP